MYTSLPRSVTMRRCEEMSYYMKPDYIGHFFYVTSNLGSIFHPSHGLAKLRAAVNQLSEDLPWQCLALGSYSGASWFCGWKHLREPFRHSYPCNPETRGDNIQE